MSLFKTLLLTGFSWCAFCVAGPLAETSSSRENTTPEQTEVLGIQERRYSITDINIESYSGFAKVIDRGEIDGRLTSVSELLNRQAGVQVKTTGGFGSFNTISIRGSTGRQVNAYLDGMLLNSPSSGLADLTTIPTVLIERIEIYPSLTPVQLGHANLAGAINIKSRQSMLQQGGQLSISAGSFSTLTGEASYWDHIDDTEFLLSLTKQQAENDYAVADGVFGNDSLKRVNADFEQETLFFKIRQHFDNASVQWLLQYSDGEHGLPTEFNKPTDDARRIDESIRNQFVVDYNMAEFSIAHRAYLMNENQVLDDRSGTLGTSQPQHVASDVDAYGLINAVERRFSQHQFALSLELRRDEYKKENLISNTQILSADRQSMIVGLSDEWFLHSQFSVNALARLFYVEDEVDQLVREDEKNSVSISEPTMQLGLKYKITDFFVLKTNFGQVIRMPTMGEKYGEFGSYQGDPDLKHETVNFIDAGFEIVLNNFNWQASAFYQALEDGIYVFIDSRGIGHPVNYSESTVSGIESDMEYFWQSGLYVQLRNTLMDSENLSEIRALKGKKLPGIYHFSHYLSVGWQDDWMAANLNYAFDDGLYYTGTNQIKADAKKDLGFLAEFYFNDVTLNFTARNLLNKNFMDFNYMPSPGRSIMSTLTVNF
ncbi:MAG: TonB-dependent receptor [Pseudomonadales bacterium]|nr:TonB-dependent receptor [Pseudomonadales bacterium]